MGRKEDGLITSFGILRENINERTHEFTGERKMRKREQKDDSSKFKLILIGMKNKSSSTERNLTEKLLLLEIVS